MLASIRYQLPTETRMFYLTLSNNSSMSYDPENNATHFFTKLPHSFDLTGDCGVGLSEILFSTTYFNVEDKEFWIHFRSDGESDQQSKLLPAELYKSVEFLIQTLNKVYRRSVGERERRQHQTVL